MRGGFTNANYLIKNVSAQSDIHKITVVVSAWFGSSPGTVLAHWNNSGFEWRGYYVEGSSSAISFVSAVGFAKATLSGSFASAYHTICGRNSASNSRDVWVDGTKGTANTTTATHTTAINRCCVGVSGAPFSPNNSWNGHIGNVAWYDGALSDAECEALSRGFSPLLIRPGLLLGYAPMFRPDTDNQQNDLIDGDNFGRVGTPSSQENGYRFVAPPPVFYSFPVAVAGGVTVTVPLGTLAITGQVPSVSTGVKVSAPAGTLTIQGYVPAIQTGVSVAVPAGSLAITGQVPSISTGVSVAVPTGALAITGQVPVITAGGVIANVPAGSLAITGQVPTVSTGVSVAVPAGTLTIQGYVPSLSMGVQVSVPAGALAIQGYVPTIETGVSVAVPVGSLAITGQVPTVTAGAVATTVSVPVGTLTITGYAPLVTSYLRSGLLSQIHTDIDGYLNTYDNLSKIVTHNAVDYRGVFTDVSAIGLQGGTNARDGPWVVMKSDDVDGTISYGDTVTIYSRNWTVEGIQPDGTGTTRLILIPAA